ncbi:MAG: protein kinase, partial [Polyangiaceae bacterium]|nr:protein kinase [Polyangiaceae bacterium]
GHIANRIDHPARVPVIDDGLSDQGEPFLVMELLEGMTLAELFKKGGGRMPLEKLLGVFEPVLELLEKCHEIGIIHRDIKPANIFLTKQAAVKVLDFGVARMREPDTSVRASSPGSPVSGFMQRRPRPRSSSSRPPNPRRRSRERPRISRLKRPRSSTARSRTIGRSASSPQKRCGRTCSRCWRACAPGSCALHERTRRASSFAASTRSKKGPSSRKPSRKISAIAS